MNVEELLQPISPENPGGRDCTREPPFHLIEELGDFLVVRAEIEELKRDAAAVVADGSGQGDSEQQSIKQALEQAEERAKRAKDAVGKNADPALAAKEIQKRCADLLCGMGKDLRVVQYLSLGALRERGLPGLMEGLAVFEGLLRDLPQHVHPLPEEDDPNDLSARAIVLGEITGKGMFLPILRESVLVASGPGRLMFRDAEVFENARAPDPAGIDGPGHLTAVLRTHAAGLLGKDTVSDAELDTCLGALQDEVQAARDALARLVAMFEAGSVRDGGMQSLLDRMVRLLERQRADIGAAGKATVPVGTSPPIGTAGPQTSTGGMATREDARRRIVEVAAFLERLEPSHPASLFLHRAAKLLSAGSFFDIVADMLPDQQDQVERLTGQKRKEQ